MKTTLNSCISTAPHITPDVTSVKTTELMIQRKLRRSYTAVLNYLLKKFENGQTIDEMDSQNLSYIQPTHLTSMQNVADPYIKSCKVADVYSESTLNDNVIKVVDPFTWHCVWKYWATCPQTDVASNVIKA